MLKKFKKELIMTNMVFVSIVLFLMFTLLTFYGYKNIIEDIEMVLDRPVQSKYETPIRSIEIKMNGDGTISEVLEIGEFYDQEEVKQLAVEARDRYSTKIGEVREIGNYFYKIKHIGGGRIAITFVASSFFYKSMKRLVIGYILGYIGLMIIFYLTSAYMSAKALRPVEEAWNQQKRFIADASHELKTPLAIILANNDILKRHQTSTVESELQWIDSTIVEAKHMKRLVEDMLFLAKDEYIDLEVEDHVVCLSDLVNEDILNFEAIAYEHGILVDCDIQDDIYVRGSETEFRQLGHILLDNALKYSASESGNPSIMVTLKQEEMITLKIRNSSEIIPKEEQKEIFNRFYMADKSRTKNGERGFGLGLSIAKSIVERYGGNISVNSGEHCGPGGQQGTEFVITFKKKHRVEN